MTHNADFKRLVRARMRDTGESYTRARHALSTQPVAPQPIPPSRTTPPADPGEVTDKTLRTFFDGDRLRSIPARRKARVVVLLELLRRFEPGRAYPEKEVNAILGAAHEDFAYLRRELVNYGYLERSDGIYRTASRVPQRSRLLAAEVPAGEADVVAGHAASAAGPASVEREPC